MTTCVGKIAVHLAVAGDAFDGVLFCIVLFRGHELSQFLKTSLPTLSFTCKISLATNMVLIIIKATDGKLMGLFMLFI